MVLYPPISHLSMKAAWTSAKFPFPKDIRCTSRPHPVKPQVWLKPHQPSCFWFWTLGETGFRVTIRTPKEVEQTNSVWQPGVISYQLSMEYHRNMTSLWILKITHLKNTNFLVKVLTCLGLSTITMLQEPFPCSAHTYFSLTTPTLIPGIPWLVSVGKCMPRFNQPTYIAVLGISVLGE